MKSLLNLLVLTLFVLSANAQSKVKFEVRNFAINSKEVMPEKPIIIEANFKKVSEVYVLGTSNNQEVGVRFSIVKEGTGFYDLIVSTEGIEDGEKVSKKSRFKFNGIEYIESSTFR